MLKFREGVKVHVGGVKILVGVKIHVISVKFKEGVNFLESWRLTLKFLDDLELDRYFMGPLGRKLYTTIVFFDDFIFA